VTKDKEPKPRSKRDLMTDPEKTFPQRFSEFIASYPTEQEGLAAYEALPD
jgi:hypothetical protein